VADRGEAVRIVRGQRDGEPEHGRRNRLHRGRLRELLNAFASAFD
jgi:hypothetical protein